MKTWRMKQMCEKNEKYPQLIIGTDGLYQIFIDKDVELRFDSAEAIEEFFKHKNVSILGKKANRVSDMIEGEYAKDLLWRITQ